MMNESRLVPGVGRLPYPAYRGKEPYIFVTYAHLDHEEVFKQIAFLNQAGFNVWYDEGIAPGNEWTDEIADALAECAVFIVMITPTSVARENVTNEVNFALDENKPLLAIHLEETELKRGLKLRIGSKQAILKYNMSEEEYEYKLIDALTRMGLKSNAHTENKTDAAEDISKLDELADRLIRAHEKKIEDPSLAEAQKNAFDKIIDIDGFQIQGGLLRGYKGEEKDLVLPPSVTVVNAASFKECNEFIKSVDLNNVSVMTAGTFTDCPKLKRVKASEKLKPIYPHVFKNCPKLTLYIRHDQLTDGFEKDFCGKEIEYLDE